MNEDLANKIAQLKQEKNAVILVHNYQPPEVQDIADYLGDSLGLSRRAAETDADIIVFCGVHFMAETAYILSPDKTVLLPDIHAGCPMADMIDADRVRDLKSRYPDAAVVSYVNTTAEVKAESDICCTSANAVEVVESISEEQIIFIPDKYLGQYVKDRTNKEVILSSGYCPTHVKILPDHIEQKKKDHSDALVMVHPECPPAVTACADLILSTGGMIREAHDTDRKEIIVATETGIIYRLAKENPDKIFYPAYEGAVCPNMKKITLEKVIWTLKEMRNQVTVEEHIREKAYVAITKMLDTGNKGEKYGTE